MTLEDIKIIVESEFDFTDISVNSRKGLYPEARAVYCILALEFLKKKSLSNVGKVIKRDHATVLHARKMFGEYVKDIIVKEAYNNCYSRVIQFIDSNKGNTEFNLNAHLETIKLKNKLDTIKKTYNEMINDLKIIHERENNKLKLIIKNLSSELPIKYLLSELNEKELKEVEDRLIPIVKMLLSRRTYENTNKSSFNVKTSREMIKV